MSFATPQARIKFKSYASLEIRPYIRALSCSTSLQLSQASARDFQKNRIAKTTSGPKLPAIFAVSDGKVPVLIW